MDAILAVVSGPGSGSEDDAIAPTVAISATTPERGPRASRCGAPSPQPQRLVNRAPPRLRHPCAFVGMIRNPLERPHCSACGISAGLLQAACWLGWHSRLIQPGGGIRVRSEPFVSQRLSENARSARCRISTRTREIVATYVLFHRRMTDQTQRPEVEVAPSYVEGECIWQTNCNKRG